jgi:hypothetical protein
MGLFLRAIQEGGTFAYLILLAWLTGLVLATLLPLLRARGRRVPAVFYGLAPAGALSVGLLATHYGYRLAMDAAERASPEIKQVLIASGLSVSYSNVFSGGAAAASVFAMGALGWGLALLKQPEEPGEPGIVGVGAAVGVLATAWVFLGVGPMAAVAVGAASLGLVAAQLHRPAAEDAVATAGERVGIAGLLVGAAGSAMLGTHAVVYMQTFEATARASAETKQAVMDAGLQALPVAWSPVVVAMLALGYAGWEVSRHLELRAGTYPIRAGAAVALLAVPTLLWLVSAPLSLGF